MLLTRYLARERALCQDCRSVEMNKYAIFPILYAYLKIKSTCKHGVYFPLVQVAEIIYVI